MSTPLRRRFAVDTLLQDKTATVDVLNRAGLITTNNIFSGERYRLLTPDSYADEVSQSEWPLEFRWLQTHFSQEGGAPADVAVIYWNKTGTTVPETAGESFTDAMNDFYARGGNAYFYAYAGVNADAIADQKTIAAWVQSSTENKAQALFMTTDPNAPLNTATSDVGYQLRNTSMERATVIYHPTGVVNGVDMTGQRPDAAILGRMLWTNPGAQQWDYKTLTTASDSGLSPTEQNNLRAKGYNFVETFTNVTFTHLYKGRTCTDREIRIQWGADWVDNNLQASLANYAFRTPLMAFDEETFTDVEALIREWMERAVDRRIILDDYTVSLPDPDSIPASVRKSGQASFNDVYQATLNSAIDGWVVRGTWSIGGI